MQRLTFRFGPLKYSPSLPIGASWLSQKKVLEHKIVFAGGDGAAARGASNPAISYLQPRLSSNDLIERVAMWAIEMNLWTRHDTLLPALGGAPAQLSRSGPGLRLRFFFFNILAKDAAGVYIKLFARGCRMSNRDEFSKETKLAVALRASHLCSFPGCLQLTAGPSDEAPMP